MRLLLVCALSSRARWGAVVHIAATASRHSVPQCRSRAKPEEQQTVLYAVTLKPASRASCTC